MIGYASRTGTRRNLAALRAAGWHLIVSARGVLRSEGFPYALDNGAWTAFREWQDGAKSCPDPDLRAFRLALSKVGRNANFIVVPDVVMGGARSWALSRYWLRRLRRDARLRNAKLLIAVQNGFDPWTVAKYLSPRVGVFVGGDTEWKLATMASWAQLAHARGAICHVGRVNTARRIRACEAAGVDSFDGSSASRFAETLPALERARQQIDLEGYLARRAA
nr:hypothetical protein [uncultured Sphingomonas sp.]